MEKVLTKADVQAQLQAKSDDIARRIEALGAELSMTGGAIGLAFFRNPLVSVGGAVLGGLLVGLLFGGRKRRGARGLPKVHAELVDRYVDTVAEEARRIAGRGRDAGEAVREALRDRTPLIVYAPGREQSREGLLRQAIDLTLKTLAAVLVKEGIDLVTGRLDGARLARLSAASNEPAEGTAPVAAAVADET